MSDAIPDARARRRSLFVVISAATAVAVTLGLTWPLLSLILKAQGVDEGLIGLSAASQMLAIVVIVPLTPRLLIRLGTRRLISLTIAAMALLILLLPVYPNVYAWFPIRFLLGASVEILLITCDIWVNQVAEERTRGRVVGLYAFALSAGFACGPLIINATGTAGGLPFLIGAAIVGLGALPLIWAKGLVPPMEGEPSGRLLDFVRAAPTLMIAGVMFGLIEGAFLPFLPLYGLAHGLGESAAVTVLTVLIAGSAAGQLPIGWLADHIDRRLMIVGCVAAILLGSLLLPSIIGNALFLWPVMAVMGAAMGGFYTIGMVMIGRRFRGPDLAAVNTAFVVVWGAGSVAGPALTGWAMDLWGAGAMPLVAAAFCAVYLPFAVARYLQRRGN